MATIRWARALAWAGVSMVSVVTTVAAAPPLDTDLRHYGIFANREARLKNLVIQGPGCNIGVNCAQPQDSSTCGVLRYSDVDLSAAPTQIVADAVCGDGAVYQLFRNRPLACGGPACPDVVVPGAGPNCEDAFSTPIIGDLDGDQIPSCGPGCLVDLDDMAKACGVTRPLPACSPGRDITVFPGEDCSDGDVQLGNQRCDLGPGSYGSIRVRKFAEVVFGPGTVVACSLTTSRSAVLDAVPSGAMVLVPGKGSIRLSADKVGSECSRLRFVAELGKINFGKAIAVVADACSIGGRLSLGHNNTLRGHFFGDQIVTDVNTVLQCCQTTTTTTTKPTTTTTTKPTTTTTTKPTTTTTTKPTTTTTTKPSTTTTTKATTTTTKATTSTTKATTTSTKATTTSTKASTTSTKATTTTTLKHRW